MILTREQLLKAGLVDYKRMTELTETALYYMDKTEKAEQKLKHLENDLINANMNLEVETQRAEKWKNEAECHEETGDEQG
jgi:hypothetical protein